MSAWIKKNNNKNSSGTGDDNRLHSNSRGPQENVDSVDELRIELGGRYLGK